MVVGGKSTESTRSSNLVLALSERLDPDVFPGLVGRENVITGTDCGLDSRVHPQIAWAKLRALRHGAVIASKKLWS